MKKIKVFTVYLILLVAAISFASPTFAALSETSIKARFSGATFYVPVGWSESEIEADADFLQTKIVCDIDNDVMICYGCTDVWAELPDGEKESFNYDRRNITNKMFTKQEMADNLNVEPSEISKARYNNYEYFVVSTPYNLGNDSINISLNMLTYFSVVNGYMHQFIFYGTQDNPHFPEFEELLNSADLGPASSGKSTATSNMPINSYSNFFLSLLLTMIIYSLPIFVYRYLIRKLPVEHKKATIITIVYAIIGFTIMVLLLFRFGGSPNGTAIFVWSFINYKMLTHGYKRSDDVLPDEQSENQDDKVAIIEEPVYKPLYIQSYILKEDGTIKDCQMDANKFKFDYKQYLHNNELYFYEKTQDGKTRNVIVTKTIFDTFVNKQKREQHFKSISNK